MTNSTSPRREQAPVAGLLWISNMRDTVRAAPIWLGGQRLDEQERIVKQRVERDRPGNTNLHLYIVVIPLPQTIAQRYATMLDLLAAVQISRLYVPEMFYADDNPQDVRTLITAARVLHGTEVIICEDE